MNLSSHEKAETSVLYFHSLLCSLLDAVSAHNSSLDYLRGTLGYSYMCREEQTLNVAQVLSINTFQVQVQPFGLTGNQFGAGKHTLDAVIVSERISSFLSLICPRGLTLAAEECQLDEDDMLIPIIVGAALAGLVLIVLLAYLIGRKRSHAGYQTIWGGSSLSSSPGGQSATPTILTTVLRDLTLLLVPLCPSILHLSLCCSLPLPVTLVLITLWDWYALSEVTHSFIVWRLWWIEEKLFTGTM